MVGKDFLISFNFNSLIPGNGRSYSFNIEKNSNSSIQFELEQTRVNSHTK